MSSPVVLITGAARRVGAEIARTLHASGARVMLHYRRSADEAAALAAALNAVRPDSAATVCADLADSAALAAAVEATVTRFGRLDGLVNNASSFWPTPVGSIGENDWQQLMDGNLKGALFLAQAAAPHLRATGGAIVNITDIHAERPLAGYPVYSAAKAGLLGLTRALAIELAPQVRVNAVAPGAIAWPD
ncbi:MAG TPA: SDR family NAD(P)-dependent oxidoreductase, partial [Rhodocyclaceae bacterium]